jgi:hypothetical protein
LAPALTPINYDNGQLGATAVEVEVEYEEALLGEKLEFDAANNGWADVKAKIASPNTGGISKTIDRHPTQSYIKNCKRKALQSRTKDVKLSCSCQEKPKH